MYRIFKDHTAYFKLVYITMRFPTLQPKFITRLYCTVPYTTHAVSLHTFQESSAGLQLTVWITGSIRALDLLKEPSTFPQSYRLYYVVNSTRIFSTSRWQVNTQQEAQVTLFIGTGPLNLVWRSMKGVICSFFVNTYIHWKDVDWRIRFVV